VNTVPDHKVIVQAIVVMVRREAVEAVMADMDKVLKVDMVDLRVVTVDKVAMDHQEVVMDHRNAPEEILMDHRDTVRDHKVDMEVPIAMEVDAVPEAQDHTVRRDQITTAPAEVTVLKAVMVAMDHREVMAHKAEAVMAHKAVAADTKAAEAEILII
jgi:hypothetical protein